MNQATKKKLLWMGGIIAVILIIIALIKRAKDEEKKEPYKYQLPEGYEASVATLINQPGTDTGEGIMAALPENVQPANPFGKIPSSQKEPYKYQLPEGYEAAEVSTFKNTPYAMTSSVTSAKGNIGRARVSVQPSTGKGNNFPSKGGNNFFDGMKKC